VPPSARPRRLSTVPSLRRAAGTTFISAALASAAQAQTGPGYPGAAPTPSAPATQAGPQPQSGVSTGAVVTPPVAVQGSQGTGYQSRVPSYQKLTEPLVDTPQSINVLPRQLLNDQGVSTVTDALRNVPGISLAAGEAGAQGNNLTLRGFTARNDFYLDGMRDFGSYFRDPFNLETIEVLKGPASILFGRGSTGGVINQVSKRPTLSPITTGTAAIGTDGTYRLTTDVNRKIEGLDGAALRLNVMGHLNGVAGRDAAEYRRWGIAPSLAFGIGTATRLNIDFFHLQEYNTPDYGLPWLFASPAPVKRSNFYGFADSDYLRTNVNIRTVRIEHDLNDSVTLRDQFRYASYGRSLRITEPLINYAGVTQATPLSALTINRNMIAVTSTETFLQNQTDVVARFSTGPIEHALVAGIEIGQETTSPSRLTYSGVPGARLLSANPFLPFVAPSRLSTRVESTSNIYSAYITDTLKMGEHWELIGGFRWDTFETSYKQTVAPVVNLNRTDNMPSYRAAIVYKPAPNGSIYFAYGTSFNPSAETLTLV
jgi:catecholate siderophore receptor